jgi:lipoprotein-anchoring transpeptidase ErfK/SrfK
LLYAGAPQPGGGAPNVAGKVILVSIAQQWMWGYDHGTLMLASPITTGMPQLPTPTGTYSVFWKVEDTEFISPWPPGSPYYYSPEHVNYALEFKAGSFFLHDAPWRLCFGPGTNVPHTCPGATVQETGSHGCVNMPTPTGAWVYAWTPDGTTVIIR